MLKHDPRDFRKSEAEDNKHGPEVYYELTRTHPICVLDNGMMNGQPYTYERTWRSTRTNVKTRIYATTFEICMLPTVRIKRNPDLSVEACFELAFDALKPSVLKGKELMSKSRDTIHNYSKQINLTRSIR